MECPVGTSFTNPTNAAFVRELVATLYRDNPIQNTRDSLTKDPEEIRKGSVLVLTGYRQQKYEYNAQLAQLCSAKVPEGCVSVRTIDDSSSHEADVVRTLEDGFLSDHYTFYVLY
ncbi:MFS monocarboxylate transporter [Ilyonectria robusta]